MSPSPKLGWLLINVVAIILSATNFVGYWRCRRDSKKQAAQAAQSIMQKGAFMAISQGPTFMSNMFGGNSAENLAGVGGGNGGGSGGGGAGGSSVTVVPEGTDHSF